MRQALRTNFRLYLQYQAKAAQAPMRVRPLTAAKSHSLRSMKNRMIGLSSTICPFACIQAVETRSMIPINISKARARVGSTSFMNSRVRRKCAETTVLHELFDEIVSNRPRIFLATQKMIENQTHGQIPSLSC